MGASCSVSGGRGEVGTDRRGQDSFALGILGLLLAEEGILETNGTMFIVKLRLWLSLNKTSSPVALKVNTPLPTKGVLGGFLRGPI